LNAQIPLLDGEALNHTRKLVSDFQTGSGKELNQQLIEQDKLNKHTSYISAPWFDMYLKDRQSIVLNYNPFLSFIKDAREGYMDQTIRAANFLVSAIRFRHTLKTGMLEPEVYHLNPKKSDTAAFRTVTSLLPSAVSWLSLLTCLNTQICSTRPESLKLVKTDCLLMKKRITYWLCAADISTHST